MYAGSIDQVFSGSLYGFSLSLYNPPSTQFYPHLLRVRCCYTSGVTWTPRVCCQCVDVQPLLPRPCKAFVSRDLYPVQFWRAINPLELYWGISWGRPPWFIILSAENQNLPRAGLSLLLLPPSPSLTRYTVYLPLNNNTLSSTGCWDVVVRRAGWR
jgi:hypothetical protein